MKTKQSEKKTCNRYSAEFKEQVLKLAEKDGMTVTARGLGLAESQIYDWQQKHKPGRAEAPAGGTSAAEAGGEPVGRGNAFLKKATAYFAKQPK